MGKILHSPDFSKTTLLFGGSFDPLHLGHIRMIEHCREEIEEIEQSLLVPCAHSPGKFGLSASKEQRLRWLEKGTPESIAIWTEELNRGGESYTIDTLKAAHRLGATSDALFLLMGADSYASLTKWKSPSEIRKFATIVVAQRPTIEFKLSDQRDKILDLPPVDISSTAIRSALREGQIPEESLPAAITDDIREVILNSGNPYAK